MGQFIWKTKNPLGTEVVLKTSTYECHILDTEKRSNEEINNLKLVADDTKYVIENPLFIYYDKNYKDNRYHRYINLIANKEFSHSQALVAIVGTKENPNQVVTWTIKRNLKQELIPEGGGRL